MDAYEATKVVFARIQALDPEHASKIMGMLLIQDHGEKEMIRLAFGPEHVLQSLIVKTRAELGLKSSPPSPAPPAGPSWGPPNAAGGDEVAFAGGEEVGGFDQGGVFYPEEYGCWAPASGAHRRSYSLSDAEAAAAGGGWKPCLYFARGYCKNGSACRFVHGCPDDATAAAAAAGAQHELLLRAKAAAARSQLMASAFPFSPSSKGVNFLLQQQQNERMAGAAAAAMLLGAGEEAQKYAMRSPRMERGDLAASLANPGARQIYLTFPADSTFSEEDVSNYFSIYGPVQDVRIPYQQKRMFGFVTFVYPDTVKMILAKGNPHFVCDARVLVKPYKEKGKVPDKFRKLQQQQQHVGDRGDFAGCTTPTGLLDSRDPFELPQIGSRMLYGNSSGPEALLRRKLEEQQQAAELQQAIELQGRRFMGLQLLDLKTRSHHHHQQFNSPMSSPVSAPTATEANNNGNGNGGVTGLEDGTGQDKKLNSGVGVALAALPASAAISAIASVAAEGKQQQPNGFPQHTVNPGEEGKKESGPEAAAAPNASCDFQESGLEHNLPDSPFASPTRACIDVAAHTGSSSSSTHLMATSLFPPASTLDLPSYSSCFFQMPRFSSGHGAIGM